MTAQAILKKIFGLGPEGSTYTKGDLGLETPIDDVEFVVFDTELTGLDTKKDSIVSIGALRMKGSRIEVGKPFYRVVDPRTELTGKSIVIHGITPSETQGCPDMATLLPEFLEFCGESVLVGHHVMMDVNFVNNEIKRATGGRLQNTALDTILLYRSAAYCDSERCAFFDPENEDVSLFALAGRYDIEVSGAHNALADAYITAQLFQRIISILQGRGIRTLGDLLRTGKP